MLRGLALIPAWQLHGDGSLRIVHCAQFLARVPIHRARRALVSLRERQLGLQVVPCIVFLCHVLIRVFCFKLAVERIKVDVHGQLPLV